MRRCALLKRVLLVAPVLMMTACNSEENARNEAVVTAARSIVTTTLTRVLPSLDILTFRPESDRYSPGRKAFAATSVHAIVAGWQALLKAAHRPNAGATHIDRPGHPTTVFLHNQGNNAVRLAKISGHHTFFEAQIRAGRNMPEHEYTAFSR